MIVRLAEKQGEHDSVIDELENIYQKQYPKVYKNPNEQKNMHVKGYEDLWPDIIVVNAENTVQFIEEVETEDSVNEEHAKEQWAPYSKIGATFYLRVPLESHIEARRIIRDLGLNISVKCYKVDAGQVKLMEC